jgi:hypothetical protein
MVDDTAGMRRRERARQLHGDVEHGPKRHRRRHETAQGLTLHQLHRDERHVVLFADAIDRDDIRMVQR